MNVTVPCDTEAHLLPDATITLKSSKIIFTMSNKQLLFLLHVAADNLLQPVKLADGMTKNKNNIFLFSFH
jgi:hypothetical protein